ncbi:MAG: glycosyltransferase [Candidatus Pacebacteria bacterium]|nr:glycosyltransferase [Candidatus Paceibacterota bacterium]
MIKVLIDTSPLTTLSAIRGIGVYTRLMCQHLEKIEDLEIRQSVAPGDSSEFKPDIIHYPYFDLFFDTLPFVKTQRTVVTIHDVIPLLFMDKYQPGLKGRLRFEKQRVSLWSSDAIITDSYASKEDIKRQLLIKEKKMNVVYLAGNPGVEAVGPRAVGEVKKKYNLPEDYILYVGDINYNKNIPQLIKALKYLPENIKLVLLGKNFKPQEIEEWQWIETQIAMSDVNGRVQFLPEILGQADAELSAIYTGARVYVQPSLYEGFGLPVLEAMQAKTPVVCARNSSLIEVGGNSVIFTDPDGEALAEGVNQFLEMETEDRHDWVEKALAWSKTFSWDKTAQETADVYRQVMGLTEK